MTESIWPTIHSERQALAEDVANLTPEQIAYNSAFDAGWNAAWNVGFNAGFRSATTK